MKGASHAGYTATDAPVWLVESVTVSLKRYVPGPVTLTGSGSYDYEVASVTCLERIGDAVLVKARAGDVRVIELRRGAEGERARRSVRGRGQVYF